MITQQLLDYIKQQLQEGINQEEIKSSLLANGWQAEDIDEAFALIQNPASQSSQASPPPQTITSLPNATTILRQAWIIYKQRLGTFLGIIIIPILILLIFLVFNFLINTYFFYLKSNANLTFALFLSIIFMLIIFLIGLWQQIALIYAIKDNQERIGIFESYRRSWRKIISYCWIHLLKEFIVIGGYFLFIVPGIIFSVWFSLAKFILIAEDLKGMNAILKSREYIKGKFGSVIWRFVFIFLIFSIFLIIFLISIFVLVPIFLGVNMFVFVPIFLVISMFVFALLLTPLVETYLFLVYSNLKTLKGDFAFLPTRKEKNVFILIGVFGFLLFCFFYFINLYQLKFF